PRINGQVAQLVEQRTENPRVGGSIPPLATTTTRARRHSMVDDLAATNVNRSYSLAATSIAIFTFMLFFLYPRFARGEINAVLFQAMLVVMGVATFSFVFASFYYYCAPLGDRIDDAQRATYLRRGDRFWL